MTSSVKLSPPLLRPAPALIAAAWGAVALVAAAQTLAAARLDGVDAAGALVRRLAILPLWAAATPAILRSARRFPVYVPREGAEPRHLALHLLLGSLFVVFAN